MEFREVKSMSIEEIRQQIIDDGGNPDDYYIYIMSENSYQVWKKEAAPNWVKYAEQRISETNQVIDTMLGGAE